MNNHVVIVPRNTIFQMPATTLTWKELFTQAPGAVRGHPAQNGLTLRDSPQAGLHVEVPSRATVQATARRRYIAGLIFISESVVADAPGFHQRHRLQDR